MKYFEVRIISINHHTLQLHREPSKQRVQLKECQEKKEFPRILVKLLVTDGGPGQHVLRIGYRMGKFNLGCLHSKKNS